MLVIHVTLGWAYFLQDNSRQSKTSLHDDLFQGFIVESSLRHSESVRCRWLATDTVNHFPTRSMASCRPNSRLDTFGL